MRGLFTKIFLGFWIAQSLTFVISTVLILQHRYVWPGDMMQILKATVPSKAAAAANAFERSGCAGLKSAIGALPQTSYLADEGGNLLCTSPTPDAINALKQAQRATGGITMAIGRDFWWSATVQADSGRHYHFLLSLPLGHPWHGWHDLSHFAFPQLPVAIVVCGITTFVLVLLLTRPIGRLRAAARKLAHGELATRIPNPGGERIFGGDEIQGLVRDFNYMAERLERLVGAQHLLLRDVSHELRSPLARLSVALELAREEAPPAMDEQLERIEREAERLNLLIGQLLQLSSMESTDAPSAEVFSLHSVVKKLLPDAEFEAEQRSCHIRLVQECDCEVRGNAELLYRAIENILRNAIRYTREGSAVEVAIGCEERPGARTLSLEISDHGPGLPEDELEKVFRPFYRADDARQRDTGGFGVGLAIAERAVRLHHGELRARNRPGGGLTVTLRLPCAGSRIFEETEKTADGRIPLPKF